MLTASMSDVTQILGRVESGDAKAAEELLPLVYEELRKLAANKMARELPGQTLQPTALVHEVWLRLSQQERSGWKNREQFYAMAAEVMRRILVDRARRRRAEKHGGDLQRVDLDAIEIAVPGDHDLVQRVNEALDRRKSRGGEAQVLCRPGQRASCRAARGFGEDSPATLGFCQSLVGARNGGGKISLLRSVRFSAAISRIGVERLYQLGCERTKETNRNPFPRRRRTGLSPGAASLF